MNARERMIEFCKLEPAEQHSFKEDILKTLEEFLKTCSRDDLEVLNYLPKKRVGLHLNSKVIAMISAYGNRFYNLSFWRRVMNKINGV